MHHIDEVNVFIKYSIIEHLSFNRQICLPYSTVLFPLYPCKTYLINPSIPSTNYVLI